MLLDLSNLQELIHQSMTSIKILKIPLQLAITSSPLGQTMNIKRFLDTDTLQIKLEMKLNLTLLVYQAKLTGDPKGLSILSRTRDIVVHAGHSQLQHPSKLAGSSSMVIFTNSQSNNWLIASKKLMVAMVAVQVLLWSTPKTMLWFKRKIIHTKVRMGSAKQKQARV
jgi:hypothetical protein